MYWPSLDYWIPDSGPQRIANGSLVDDYFHADDYRSSDFLGASVSLTFNGSYIAYYCDLYPSHGTTEVNLDGQKTTVSSHSSLQYDTPQVKLFEAHVDPSVLEHTITLTNLEDKWQTGLDYFLYIPPAYPQTIIATEGTESHTPTSASVVLSVTSSHSSPSPYSEDREDGPSRSGTISTASWAAIVSVLALGLLVMAAVFFLRRRRSSAQTPSGRIPPENSTLPPGLPRQAQYPSRPSLPPPPAYSSIASTSLVPAPVDPDRDAGVLPRYSGVMNVHSRWEKVRLF